MFLWAHAKGIINTAILKLSDQFDQINGIHSQTTVTNPIG